VKLILVKLLQLNLKKNKLKFSVKVILKKDVLDPQGKVVQQTLQNMGMDTLKNLRQGKYFEIEINENNEEKAVSKIEDMCKKLLVNLIIEDFNISKI
jgi:phosphoribosylformylglycinamidine synthase